MPWTISSDFSHLACVIWYLLSYTICSAGNSQLVTSPGKNLLRELLSSQMHKPFLAQTQWESKATKFTGAKCVSFISATSCCFKRYCKNRTENFKASLEDAWNCSYRQAKLIIVHGKNRYNILKYFACNKKRPSQLCLSCPIPSF